MDIGTVDGIEILTPAYRCIAAKSELSEAKRHPLRHPEVPTNVVERL